MIRKISSDRELISEVILFYFIAGKILFLIFIQENKQLK